MPIREFGYVQGANAKITELTGVSFGDGYNNLIADGSFVMDSRAAAHGILALAGVAPDRVLELAGSLQTAFYVDGLSLSEPSTYRTVAIAAGLDADAVVEAFTAGEADAAASQEFARAASLGVQSYPTLLAVDGDRVTILAVGHAGADDIDSRLATLTAA